MKTPKANVVFSFIYDQKFITLMAPTFSDQPIGEAIRCLLGSDPMTRSSTVDALSEAIFGDNVSMGPLGLFQSSVRHIMMDSSVTLEDSILIVVHEWTDEDLGKLADQLTSLKNRTVVPLGGVHCSHSHLIFSP